MLRENPHRASTGTGTGTVRAPGRISRGTYRRREDQSTAARTSDVTDAAKPISHPAERCELMIAAIGTAIPTMPAQATVRISGASSGSRLRRFAIITRDAPRASRGVLTRLTACLPLGAGAARRREFVVVDVIRFGVTARTGEPAVSGGAVCMRATFPGADRRSRRPELCGELA